MSPDTIPRHVVLEGTHGVGKTTALERSVIDAVKVPSLLVGYELLTALPGDPRAVFYVNDVAKCAVRNLLPLQSSLMDRSYSSSLAFAAFQSHVFADLMYLRTAKQRVEKALDRGLLMRADLTLVFDLDPDVAWTRVRERDGGSWTDDQEVTFLREFHLAPPDWFLGMTCEEYIVHKSGTVEDNIRAIAEQFPT